MIRKVLSGIVSLIILCILSYLVFFVPLGERTLSEHIRRIAATPEAEDLGRDAARASERIEETVRDEIEKEAATAE
jgi:hypothetical protein